MKGIYTTTSHDIYISGEKENLLNYNKLSYNLNVPSLLSLVPSLTQIPYRAKTENKWESCPKT